MLIELPFITIGNFGYIIVLAVIAYMGLLRMLKLSLYDNKELKQMMEESAQLRKELAEAEKANDKKKLDEIAEKADRTTKKAMAINIRMFKNLFILSAVFISAMWILHAISPYERDDISIQLLPDNPNCPLEKAFAYSNLSFYSACHVIEEGVPGTWRIEFKGDSGNLIADDYAIIQNGSKNEVKHDSPKQIYVMQGRENRTYTHGETLKIYAIKNSTYAGTNITAVLSNGTTLLWRLPFMIPIINVDNITDVNGAFILTVFVIGYASSIVTWIYKKLSGKKNDVANTQKEVGNNDKANEQKHEQEKDFQEGAVGKDQDNIHQKEKGQAPL